MSGGQPSPQGKASVSVHGPSDERLARGQPAVPPVT